ncbi:MAG: hypothetical protein NC207_01180 [Bacteroides sp.]|nr:hypothetical protein [Bacteroides sp.]
MSKSYIICHMSASIDGRKGMTAVSDGIKTDINTHDYNPYHLTLESVESCEQDTVWIRYKVLNV